MANTFQPSPEHDKFRPHQEDANTIGEFIEWLPSHEYIICQWVESKMFPGEGEYRMVNKTIQEFIAEYFGIDKKAFDAETEEAFRAVSEAANARRSE